MKKALVTIGKKQYSDRQIKSLQAIIKQNYRTHISHEKLIVLWNVIEEDRVKNDSGFQTLIVIENELDVVQEILDSMVKYSTRDWRAITGKEGRDVFLKFTKSLKIRELVYDKIEHFSRLTKTAYSIRLVLSLCFSYPRKGFFMFRS